MCSVGECGGVGGAVEAAGAEKRGLLLILGGPMVAYMFSASSPPSACRLWGCGVNRSFLLYSLLCPYTLSLVESDVLELNGLDSLEELEQTLAGQGGLLGAMLAAPGPGRLLSGFWAISEKY